MGFFYGASQSNVCGGRALLFLPYLHHYDLTMGLGEGSNNYAELLNVKLLLIFVAEKGCQILSLFGDSLNFTN